MTLKLHEDKNGDSSYWHLIDSDGSSIIVFLDYMIHLIDNDALSPRTVEGRAYSLLQLFRFLKRLKLSLYEFSDAHLRQLRDERLIHRSLNSSGDQRARRRIVNQELRHIYNFISWLQEDPSHSDGRRILGPHGYQITSTLSISARLGGSSKRDGRQLYPLCYRSAAERSKHTLSFVPGTDERSLLIAHFYATFNSHLARRNCLILDIAWLVGWRRSSITSLRVDDFASATADTDGFSWISPRIQKFGYRNSFKVPFRLMSQVRDFITADQQLRKRPCNNDVPELFVSYRTGRPLTPRAVSAIFNRARLALGWPRGAGLHSWRRGFASAHIDREVSARIELGMDTSSESIAISVASALGHESFASQSAYIRDAQRRLRSSNVFKNNEDRERLEAEIDRLRIEVQDLRSKITD